MPGFPQHLTLPILGAAHFLPVGIPSRQQKMDALLQDTSGEEQPFGLALSYRQIKKVTDFE